MDFEKKVPEWKASGTEPPESLKTSGFQTGYKPPAAYFNWFWNLVGECLKEIREKLSGHASDKNNPHGVKPDQIGAAFADMRNVENDVFRDKANDSGVLGIPIASASSEDGVDYHATFEGVTELYNGLILTIIPDINSSSNVPTLNVNDLGEKMIRLPLSFNTAAVTTPRNDTYFTAGRPVTLQYDSNYGTTGAWKVFGKQRTSAQDLYGTVPIESGGTGATTLEEVREILGISLDGIGALSSEKTLTATFAADGWSDEAPYTQTVNVVGILEKDEPIVDIDMSSATAETVSALENAFSAIGKITTADGSVTAFCFTRTPSTNVTVRMKVVR